MRLFCLIFIFFATGFPLFCQKTFEYKGEVTDSVTSAPIADAIVMVKGTTINVFTSKSGQFNFTLKWPECVLVISQLGYKTREIKLDNYAAYHKIRLKALPFNLEEVVVSAKKYKAVQENNNTNFLAFEFYDNLIVALVSKGMGSSSNYLQVLSLNGDLICERRAPPKSDMLFKDCLNNIQVLTTDSAYQFYYSYQHIVFLKPFSLPEFYTSLYRFKLCYDGNYYFKDKYYRGLKDVYTYVNENIAGKVSTLYTAADSNAIHSFNTDYDIRYFLSKRRMGGNPPWNVKTIIENLDLLREQEPLPAGYANLLRPSESELLCIDTCLYVFDYTNKKTITFKNNSILQKDSLNYTHALKPKAIADQDFNKVYFLSNNDKSWLYEYDLLKRRMVKREELEKFSFVSNLLIKGNVIYFLYKDKANANYRKLYIYRASF